MGHSAELCLLKKITKCNKEWNKLDPEIRHAETYASF